MTIAARDYPDESKEFPGRIDSQVSVLVKWLTDPALGERAFELQGVNPVTRDDIDDFVRKTRLRHLGPADVVVVYVTGHGREGRGGQHFLLLGDTDEQQIGTTAYRTSTLLEAVLGTDAEHVLVIVDSCQAGALDAEWAVLRKNLPQARRKLSTLGVLASADFDKSPRVGEFTTLMSLVHDRLRGPAQIVKPFLTFADLVTEIGAVLRTDGGRALEEPLWVWLPGLFEQSQCLPNPGYQRQIALVESPLEQVAVTASELDDYWVSRASGRVGPDDDAWHFAGRKDLNTSVMSFLRSDDQVLVITGVAGSGKSAVLARAVTLSDPDFVTAHPDIVDGVDPATRPPTGTINAAILARGKSSTHILTDVVVALGGSVGAGTDRALEILRELVTASGVERTVVIDGLDEALHPDRLVTDVLAPLISLRHPHTRMPLVRLVLGLRSAKPTPDAALAGDIGHALLDQLRRATDLVPVRVERTDEEPSVSTDIEAYVTALLRREGPYTHADTAVVAAAAATVAKRVAPSFLDARLAGQRLRAASTHQDLHDPAWLGTLAEGTVALFRDDLADVATAADRSVMEILAVLRAAAFGLGRGLSWSQVWAAVAEAILGRAVLDVDTLIAAVLASRLSGYLSQDVEDGRVVHRPSHERIAETLRDEAETLLATASDAFLAADHLRLSEDAVHVHRRITVALSGLGGAIPPHPYVRRYLVEHAARGGVLDDDHIPPEFLPWELGSRVRGLLGLPPPPELANGPLTVWARVEPFLHDADPMTRRISHVFACEAAKLETHEIAVGLPLRPLWAHWRLPRGNILDAATARPVLCTVTLRSGRVLLAIGGSDAVRMWDPQSGTPTGHPMPIKGVSAMAVVRSPDGRVLLAAVCGRHGISIWDAETSQRVRTLQSETHSMAVAVPTSEGRTLLATASYRAISMWDPATGQLIWEFDTRIDFGGLSGALAGVGAPEGQMLFIEALAAVPAPDGRTLLVVGHSGGVSIRDPDTGKLLPTPTKEPHPLMASLSGFASSLDLYRRPSLTTENYVKALAAVPTSDGRVLLAIASETGVSIWDAETGQRVRTLRVKGHPPTTLAAIPMSGGRALLAAPTNQGVSVWDPETGRLCSTLPAGQHTSALAAMATSDGRALLATGGGKVSIWDTKSTAPAAEFDGVSSATALAAMPTLAGRSILAVGRRDHRVSIWDAETGRQVRTLKTRHGYTLVAVPTSDGRALLATTNDHDGVSVWDAETGQRVQTITTKGPAKHLAAVPTSDGQMLLAIGQGGGVSVWDPGVGQQVWDHYIEIGGMEALAVISAPHRRALLVIGDTDGVAVADLETGRQVRTITTGAQPRHLAAVSTSGGRMLLAIAGYPGISIWDAETGELVHTLTTSPGLAIAALPMPDGRTLLATASQVDDGKISIWDPDLGICLVSLVTGGSVTALEPVIAATGMGLVFCGDRGVAHLSLGTLLL
ncbi:outer membrane protein assembly factor BamB family protein [Gordonia rhizosphera]|uniref:Pyrrolo-quinoline quinone repeat domain-containing protein n=1 Tax=Gordonia rhizosphera NBRC 16068 TaxID=1108045 RepID=K6VMM8_9ACTN|nr:PQQ-binding-like beta-propeller repeat protein [Gordonia rhizosphera]GAB88155.1 hypothetical protein GORHZ_006_00240 [Gordonia rhizosphera NBRC 16068]